MPDRRYSDEDARRILALASDVEVSQAAGEGWTLAELQRAGAEAGLTQSSIAAAAMALERTPLTDARYFGLPVAVGGAVSLPRALSDEDWERLVSRLRDTFEAEGRVRVSGARREWRVGNLRVTHEPAGEGAVLDLRTRKGNVMPLFTAGTTMLVTSAALGLVGAMAHAPAGSLRGAVFVGVMGLATIVVSAIRLPGWASARKQQFSALGDYARKLVGA